MAEKSESIKELRIDIDVSDAIKGLKALQREAKKTAKLMRALADIETLNPIITITTDANSDPKKFFDAVKKEMEKLSTECS